MGGHVYFNSKGVCVLCCLSQKSSERGLPPRLHLQPPDGHEAGREGREGMWGRGFSAKNCMDTRGGRAGVGYSAVLFSQGWPIRTSHNGSSLSLFPLCKCAWVKYRRISYDFVDSRCACEAWLISSRASGGGVVGGIKPHPRKMCPSRTHQSVPELQFLAKHSTYKITYIHNRGQLPRQLEATSAFGYLHPISGCRAALRSEWADIRTFFLCFELLYKKSCKVAANSPRLTWQEAAYCEQFSQKASSSWFLPLTVDVYCQTKHQAKYWKHQSGC